MSRLHDIRSSQPSRAAVSAGPKQSARAGSRALWSLRPSGPCTSAPAAPSSLQLGPDAQARGADLVIDYAADGCVIAHLGNMTFSAWNTAPTVEHVEAFIALARELSSRYRLNSNLTLVLPKTELPGARARASLELLTADYAPVIHSVAMVIDGGGFWASMIRSFLTGLHLLRGNGYRCKAFASAAEANPWLLPAHSADTGVTLTERDMQLACDEIYARMQARAT